MSAGQIIVLVIVLLVIAAVAVFAVRAARRRKLQNTFGPEYDRVVADTGSRADAEKELRERERRGGFTSVEQLRDVRGIGEKRFADLSDLVTV